MGSVTTIPKKYVRSGTTLPASGQFEGQLFQDTDDDQLYKWNGSSWVAVGSSPDGVTIVKNANGKLAVEEPSTDILGNWENDSPAGWNFGGSYAFGDINSTEGGAVPSSSYFARITNGTSGNVGYIEISHDLTGYDSLILYVAIGHAYEESGGSSDSLEVKIGSTVEYQLAGGSNVAWQQVEIDISGYSGTTNIQLRNNNGSNTDIETDFDLVRLKKQNTTVLPEAN